MKKIQLIRKDGSVAAISYMGENREEWALLSEIPLEDGSERYIISPEESARRIAEYEKRFPIRIENWPDTDKYSKPRGPEFEKERKQRIKVFLREKAEEAEKAGRTEDALMYRRVAKSYDK